MSLREALCAALRGLRANRLRSVLTALGIVIGVSAVILLVAMGNGVLAGFHEDFGERNTEITVSKANGSSAPVSGKIKDLTDDDAESLRDPASAPAIVSATPVVTGAAVLESESASPARTAVEGTTADYLRAAGRELSAGSFFSREQERAKTKLAVLGPETAIKMFGARPGAAVGQELRIGKITFGVAGVVRRDGQKDNVVIVPIGTFRSQLVGSGNNEVSRIIVKARDQAAVPAARDQVTRILSERHGITDPTKLDFETKALLNRMEKDLQLITFLSAFTLAIGAVSLLVGGLGVANIMLVAVSERTRRSGSARRSGPPGARSCVSS